MYAPEISALIIYVWVHHMFKRRETEEKDGGGFAETRKHTKLSYKIHNSKTNN